MEGINLSCILSMSIFVKENSLLITKVIFVCHFWKITLSIKLKKFYLPLSILLLFETLISVTSLSVGGSWEFAIIMPVTVESVNGLGKSFKFTISSIFFLFIFVELSSLISLISYFTIFASVIKSCRVTGFISTSSYFFFVFSFLSFLPFSHSVTWCPYFLHLIQVVGLSIESFNFSK